MKKKIIMALVILGFATGCGKVPVMKDGDQAVVTFEKEGLNISATNLYEKIKVNYALSNLIDMVDTKIFSEKTKSGDEKFWQLYQNYNNQRNDSKLRDIIMSLYDYLVCRADGDAWMIDRLKHTRTFEV